MSTDKSFSGYVVDGGCYLTNNSLSDIVDEIVDDAKKHDVKAVVNLSTTLRSSYQAVDLCEKSKYNLFCTVGVSHNGSARFRDEDVERIQKFLESDKVVAIGEIGLDYSRGGYDAEIQTSCFKTQLDMALASRYPIVIRERKAFKDMKDILEARKDKLKRHKVLLTCYSAEKEKREEYDEDIEARLLYYLSLGFYIGVTGIICDQRRNRLLKKLIKKHVSIDKLIPQTYSPFLAPPNCPKTNIPGNVHLIYKELCYTVKQSDLKTFSEKVCGNIYKFYGINPSKLSALQEFKMDENDFPLLPSLR